MCGLTRAMFEKPHTNPVGCLSGARLKPETPPEPAMAKHSILISVTGEDGRTQIAKRSSP
jgi:hypothetical protein